MWRKPKRDGRSGSSPKGALESARRREFLLEPLEPRILLSADPLLLGLADPGWTDDTELQTAGESSTLDDTRTAEAADAGLDAGDAQNGTEGDWADDLTSYADDAQEWSDWVVDDELTVDEPDVPPGVPATAAAAVVSLPTQDETATLPANVATEKSTETEPAESSTSSDLAVAVLPLMTDDGSTGTYVDGDVPIASEVPDDSIPRGPPTNASSDHTSTTLNSLENDVNGTAAAVASVEGTSVLSGLELTPIVDEAARRWLDSPFVDGTIAVLNEFTFRVADLPGQLLFDVEGTEVLIDIDAAGIGWFVDLSPSEDSEFETDPADSNRWVARDDGPAQGRVDLLSVLIHTVGGLLGVERPNAELGLSFNIGQRTPLPVTAAPVEFGGVTFTPATEADRERLEALLAPDGTGTTDPLTFVADVSLDGFVHLTGTFTITRGETETIDIGTGLSANLPLYEIYGSTITDETALVWTMSASDVQAFVGLDGPYFTDSNHDGVIDDSESDNFDPDAAGWSIENLNVAVVLMVPLTPGIPYLHALKATADSAQLVGMDGVIQASATNISVNVNSGGTWGLDVFVHPAVDFASSFNGDYQVGDLNFGDFDGNQRVGVELEYGLVSLFSFLHLEGSFSFEKGPKMLVDLGTGVPQNLGPLVQTTLGDAINALPEEVRGVTEVTNTGGTIKAVDVSGFVIGASNVNAFVGFGLKTSDIVPPTEDPTERPLGDLLADETLRKDLVGFSLQGLDIGAAVMSPTINKFLRLAAGFQIPSFAAGRAHVDSFEFLDGGAGIFTVAGLGLDININNGTNWNLPGIPEFGPAVIDWASSFTEDVNGDGVLDPAEDANGNGEIDVGFHVPTGGDPVVLDYDGNQRIGVTLEYGLVSLFDFVHLEGSFGFEMGPQMLVDIKTGIPGNLGSAVQATLGAAINALDEDIRGDTALENNASLLRDVDVSGFLVGATGVNAFAGFGLETSSITVPTNTSERPLGDLLAGNEDLFGFSMTGLEVGFGAFEATINDFLPSTIQIPNLATLKGHVETFDFLNGGVGFMRLAGRELTMTQNKGGAWDLPGIPKFGANSIDYASSFESTAGAKDGALEVPTGGDPVLFGFGGPEEGVELEYGLASLFDFLHIEGSFKYLKKSPGKLNLGTGVPQNLGPAFKAVLDPVLAALDPDVLGDTTITNYGGTITNVDVGGFTLGASGVNAFAGFGLETSSITVPTDTAERPLGVLLAGNEDLFGFSMTGLDIGAAILSPKINRVLPAGFKIPSFSAVNAHVESFDVLTGGFDFLRVAGRQLDVNINDGDNWKITGIPEFGPAVIDWASSYPELGELAPFDTHPDGEPDGVLRTIEDELPTFLSDADLTVNDGNEDGIVTRDELLAYYDTDDDGELELVDDDLPSEFDAFDADGNGVINGLGFYVPTGGDPVVLDYDGNQRIGVTLEYGLVSLFDFVHLEGSFGFEMGPQMLVDVATGLDELPGTSLATVFNSVVPGLTDGTTSMDPDGSVIRGLDVSGFVIGASQVNAFAGLGLETSEIDVPTDPADRPLGDLLADETLSEDLVGFSLQGLDIGVALFEATINPFLPTVVEKIPTMTAVRVSTASLEFLLGSLGDDFELSGSDIAVNVNYGGSWLGGFARPRIDWAASFPELGELAPFDTHPDGDPDGVLQTIEDELPTFLSDADLAVNDGNEDGIVTRDELLAYYDTDDDGELELVDDDLPSEFDAYDSDGNGVINGLGFYVPTGGDPVVLDYDGKARIGGEIRKLTIQISDFVHITGSVAFEKGPTHVVAVTGGLLTGLTGDAVDEVLGPLGLTLPTEVDIPATGAESASLSFLTLGASNVHAFVGMKGPYWTADPNGNGQIDANEINHDAVGLVVDDFDFGLAIMTPTRLLDFQNYFALKASAGMISLVGVEDVTVDAEDILVEVNLSSPSLYGVPFFPVVDFADTIEFASEQAVLFGDGDDVITLGELVALNSVLPVEDQFDALNDVAVEDYSLAVDHETLLSILDADHNGVIDIAEAAALLGGDVEAVTDAENADADGDGKIDPLGFEVNTGGTPVYLDMDSSVIRAQGFVELDILGSVILTGSVAFELGPTETVTLTDGNPKSVTTMTIGAANVTAFIGVGGPYWTDLDGNHEVSGPEELNGDAVGFDVTDLDVGIMLMAAVPPDLGVYLAAKLNVNRFGLVGIERLTAEGVFDIEINVGFGLSGVEPVDFDASFSEAPALFELLDTNSDDVIDEAEQDEALASDYIGADIMTAAQLVAVLNTSDGPPDDYLNISEVLDKLDDNFGAANQAAIVALDDDGNGRINTGYEVNTGNPAAPVVLDFDRFLISIRLGGEIELVDGEIEPNSIFRLYGVFLFDVDSSGLKAFVAAGLEIGPDVDSDSGDKIFNMNALGALVIVAGDADSDAGVAADIDISVSVGGALSDVLQFDASARLVFNTTGRDQTISIPAQYVDFLLGDSTIPVSEDYDSTLVSDLTLTQQELDDRFIVDPTDGSATFTISGAAPLLGGGYEATPGFYLVVTLDGDLRIARAFVITASFHLKISPQGLDLGFDGSIGLGGFGSYAVLGGAVINEDGFAAYGSLSVDIDLAGLVQVSGDASLQINTSIGPDPATVNGQSIDPDTYKIAISADIGLFGVVSARGDVELGVENGLFKIAVNELWINLFILNVNISGFIRSDGQFSLSGSLELPDDLTSDDGKWGINGGIGVSISNEGFSGSGSVDIVVSGQSFDVASAELSVTTGNDPSVYIRAEGPLSVYIEITIDSDGVDFGGGLGFLDDVIGAIGDVAEAVGDAIVEAAEVVEQAFEELGEAILELGAAIGEAIVGFVNDVVDFIDDLAGAIEEFFSSSRTIARKFYPVAEYSYSTSLSGGTLTIDMNEGALVVDESLLALAFVRMPDGSDKLVVDGPNQTRTVKVAEKQRQKRSWDWYHWGPWRDVGAPFGQVYETIEYSNMTAFDDVSRIVIHGTSGSDTIILDPASINIHADVYGNGGADTIVTGGGDDYVEGGGGDDIIFTYGGADELHGGNDDDTLVGGTGNDALFGEAGDDLLNESYDRGNDPDVLLEETNLLNGGADVDLILGSPGKDTLVGGDDDDVLTGLNNDDIYEFSDNYGTDTFADYYGKAFLDFSGATNDSGDRNTPHIWIEATNDLEISISDTGFTASAGAGHLFSIDDFIAIGQVEAFDDFEIAQLRTGTGNDDVVVTALPLYRVDIVDAGGHDTYDFDFDQTDTDQAVARVNIVDQGGAGDRIELDLDSTGHAIYLQPQDVLMNGLYVTFDAVLLNNLHMTFSAGVEELSFTDHAADTIVTTEPTSGPATLLVKSGVTINSATGGPIELLARGDFTLQAGALIETTGNVIIRGDHDDVDSTGATISLLGMINADQVEVFGNNDNDTVIVANVTSGSETTISTFAGMDTINIRTINAETTVHAGPENDTVNVGTLAPATGGNVNGIGARLRINGDGGSDTLNLDDSGDSSANTGNLTATQITGLGMAVGITYGTIFELNIGLGSGGDLFTIQSTHTIETNLESNGGSDVINIQTIDGVTSVDTGIGSDTINVGSNANGTLLDRQINSNGNLDSIGALLTIDGNSPASGSDLLNVDDTGDMTPNSGTLSAGMINGLGLSPAGIHYSAMEHLIISLGDGGNPFIVNGTHGSATVGFVEDTILNTGDGADSIVINDVIDKLVVNGEGAADTMNVNGTGAGSDSILNGDGGDDVINVRAISGALAVNGGDGADSVNVGSNAQGDTSDPDNNSNGTVNGISVLLTINGGGAGTERDRVTVDDTADNANNTGELTGSRLTGLGMGNADQSVVESGLGIDYGDIEDLVVSIGSGADAFFVSSTHDGASAGTTETTTLNAGAGTDLIHINDVSDTLVVNGEADADTMYVNGTGVGSESTLNGDGGNDIINVRSISGGTTVNGGDDSDTINVGSLTPAIAGTVNGIDALLTVNGNDPTSGSDVLNVDDTGDPDPNTGMLTATRITGLGMSEGILYGTFEELNIGLGSGDNDFTIEGTHGGTTNILFGDEDDTINVRATGGALTVDAGGGNDTINVGSLAPQEGGLVDPIAALLTVIGGDENDTLNVDDRGDVTNNALVLTRTTLTGLGMGDGIDYDGIEELNIDLGDGHDVANVQGTTALTHLHGHDGDDRFHVSSGADFGLDAGTDFLQGHLDHVTGTLNIDAGAGRNLLMVSDSEATVGDTDVLITESLVHGLAPADITYVTEGNFANGITIWTGSGDEIVTVNSTLRSPGVLTITTLNTGAGSDDVTVDLLDGIDGFFVLNTQQGGDWVEAGTSSLPLVVFGGEGGDMIAGGSGGDVLFGDRGTVQYFDDSGAAVTVLGGGGPGDRTDGSVRDSGLIATADPGPGDDAARVALGMRTTNAGSGGADTILGGGGNDIVLGGADGDTIFGDADQDLLIGDYGEVRLTGGVARQVETTHRVLGGADTMFGGTGEDILLGGAAGDVADGEAGSDLIFGDNVLLDRTSSHGDTTDPRFRALTGTLIYDDQDNDLVDHTTRFSNPFHSPVWADWTPMMLDHSVTAEAAGLNNFGDDYLAGGADDDTIFGQLGDDMIQGDGSIAGRVFGSVSVGAWRDEASGLLTLVPSFENAADGDDYIEGNGGRDVIFGNLGQDDILGGSSALFSPGSADLRPDGADMIFGGAGTRIERNHMVDDANRGSIIQLERHARDSDAILGDNGNIMRLVDASGNPLEFEYDKDGPYEARGSLRVAVRAMMLLDYTPGGFDFDESAAASDRGAADEIHGESGDDFVNGQIGRDVIFGDSEDDDLIGGYGHDWISGGSGRDGVIGDDGRIYTSRNEQGVTSEFSEPLYGVAKLDEVNEEISTPGNIQQATIHLDGELKKTVNLTPFILGDMTDAYFDPQFADDIVYGGLGGDFLHGSSGDDAISGAEALFEYFVAPENPGDVLGHGATDRANEFAAYDEFNPRRQILVDANGEFLELDEVDPTAREFLLNFDHLDGPTVGLDEEGNEIHFDGDDRIFGDLGNDWLVGGTGQDHIYGGYGDDLLNADDNHDSTIDGADPRANDVPDTHPTYEDIVYGGAGRDILIANTGGDRLIDWAGEFNSYIVPFAPFGAATISRSLQPRLFEYLYDLSESDGADPTRAADTGADPERNGEPEGEIGLVKQSDFDWHDQTGAPDDPQPGNIAGGPRDVLRSANFNSGAADGFVPDSGIWRVESGRFEVQPELIGGDAVSVFYVDNVLPSYFEMQATINAAKRTGQFDSNAFLIFDYQGPHDFRFAGIDNMINKLQMGHRNAEGWFVDVQTPMQVKPDTDYNMLLSLHGVNATLVVDNEHVLTFTYEPRVVDGISFGLNTGMVGIGAKNSISRIDNVKAQILPREITFEGTEEFPDTEPVIEFMAPVGIWTMNGTRYDSAPSAGESVAYSLVDLGNTESFQVNTLLEIEVALDAETTGGVVFDLSSDRYKFAVILPDADHVVIGHVTKSGAPVFDAVADFAMEAGVDHLLMVSLKGTSVSVAVDGQVLLGHFFNSVTADGSFGLYTVDGATSFDSIRVKTDDASMEQAAGDAPSATPPTDAPIGSTVALLDRLLEPAGHEALSAGTAAQPPWLAAALLERVTFETGERRLSFGGGHDEVATEDDRSPLLIDLGAFGGLLGVTSDSP